MEEKRKRPSLTVGVWIGRGILPIGLYALSSGPAWWLATHLRTEWISSFTMYKIYDAIYLPLELIINDSPEAKRIYAAWLNWWLWS